MTAGLFQPASPIMQLELDRNEITGFVPVDKVDVEVHARYFRGVLDILFRQEGLRDLYHASFGRRYRKLPGGTHGLTGTSSR